MKLSEAIRIGASWSGQAKRRLKVGDKTCAIGAAYEGVFGDMPNKLRHESGPPICLEKMFPHLRLKVEAINMPKDLVYYLVCGPREPKPAYYNLSDLELWICIAYLNDYCDWSRERIADWVESLENKYGWRGVESPKEKEAKDAIHQTKREKFHKNQSGT